eukprot:3725542-Rhodomonas_salina.2
MRWHGRRGLTLPRPCACACACTMMMRWQHWLLLTLPAAAGPCRREAIDRRFAGDLRAYDQNLGLVKGLKANVMINLCFLGLFAPWFMQFENFPLAYNLRYPTQRLPVRLSLSLPLPFHRHFHFQLEPQLLTARKRGSTVLFAASQVPEEFRRGSERTYLYASDGGSEGVESMIRTQMNQLSWLQRFKLFWQAPITLFLAGGVRAAFHAHPSPDPLSEPMNCARARKREHAALPLSLACSEPSLTCSPAAPCLVSAGAMQKGFLVFAFTWWLFGTPDSTRREPFFKSYAISPEFGAAPACTPPQARSLLLSHDVVLLPVPLPVSGTGSHSEVEPVDLGHRPSDSERHMMRIGVLVLVLVLVLDSTTSRSSKGLSLQRTPRRCG